MNLDHHYKYLFGVIQCCEVERFVEIFSPLANIGAHLRCNTFYMSVDYASKLSYYPNKGVCGIPEIFDDEYQLNLKVNQLVSLIRQSNYVVVHTGAGISTSVGIPDFRGPNGVWTLDKLGKKPKLSVPFEKAVPSLAHRALVELEKYDLIKFLVTQNIDGLHLRSGFPRDRLAILHGDMFLESCRSCGTMYARSTPSETMGLRQTSVSCTYSKPNKRYCRGKLHDTILDWEDDLPELDYNLAIEHSKKADLHICIGSSLQMFPAAGLPILNLRGTAKCRRSNNCSSPNSSGHKNGDSADNIIPKLVIVNLQPTKLAKYATLNINARADTVMGILCEKLGISLPPEPKISADEFYPPTIVLRSIHSTLEAPSVWRILPHPNNEHTVQIIEVNDHCTKLKLKDEGQGDFSQSTTKLDEFKCTDSLKTPIHLACKAESTL
ncbi:unnamed protein product [Trichobilharzia szidati]|nr:unnamed protein product [Trichobilharzia szidati]